MGDLDMNHFIMNPNQLRAHAAKVQDISYDTIQYQNDPYFDNIIVRLFTKGTVLFTNTRSPIEAELQSYFTQL